MLKGKFLSRVLSMAVLSAMLLSLLAVEPARAVDMSYSQNFSGGLGGWTEVIGNAAVAVENGELSLTSAGNGNIIVDNNSPDVMDGTYTITLKPDGYSRCGVVIRYSSTTNYAAIAYDTGNNWLWWNGLGQSGTLTSSGPSMASGSTHVLKVQYTGFIITLWLDGDQFYSGTVGTISGSGTVSLLPVNAGKIGVVNWYSAHTHFDNVTLDYWTGTDIQLGGIVGEVENDTNPTVGSLTNFEALGEEYMDNYNYSIGKDVGAGRAVNKVEIWNDDDSITRVSSMSDYEVYYSNDNVTFTKINNVAFSSRTENNRTVHTFIFDAVLARYIKLHAKYSDETGDFYIAKRQKDFKAFGPTLPQPSSYKMPLTGGYLNSDTDPTTGVLADWGTSSTVAVDYQSRSVGLDFSSTVPIDTVELWDSDNASTLTENNFTLYKSDNNASYTQITGWTFSTRTENNRLVYKFVFTNTNARYIKIHCNITGTGGTFQLLNISEDVRAFSNIPANSTAGLADGLGGYRSSEGDTIMLKDGRILMAYSLYQASGGDNAPCNIVSRISTDNGYTWGSLNTILSQLLVHIKSKSPVAGILLIVLIELLDLTPIGTGVLHESPPSVEYDLNIHPSVRHLIFINRRPSFNSVIPGSKAPPSSVNFKLDTYVPP